MGGAKWYSNRQPKTKCNLASINMSLAARDIDSLGSLQSLMMREGSATSLIPIKAAESEKLHNRLLFFALCNGTCLHCDARLMCQQLSSAYTSSLSPPTTMMMQCNFVCWHAGTVFIFFMEYADG